MRSLLSTYAVIIFAASSMSLLWAKSPKGEVAPLTTVSPKPPKALAHEMNSLTGKKVNLAKKYDKKVVLVVNVASRCGLTPQYRQLQQLHKKYATKGLSILGFPCNQFGRQEPGSSEEIQAFCKKNYGVEFDMFEKIEVNGDQACDLYKHLTTLDTKPKNAGKISWNFEKFLVGRDGEVIARFGPRTAPDDKKLIAAIEAALGSTSAAN